MDGSAPVLKERKEIKTWKRLTALEKAAAKGSKKNVEKLRKIIQSILDSEDYANPMIVVKLIDLVDLYLSDELQDIMLEVLEKCKLTDCAPQLQAADKLLRIGSYDSAKFILDRMTVVSDVPQWEFLRGIVDIHDGNTKSAYRHFCHVYDLDDRFLAVYNELEQLEPDKGWFSRGMIAQILSDEIPSSHTSSSDGRYGDLYNAYWEWKNGSRNSAMDLVGRIVREGIETDVELATARFYAGDKKYTEAIEHYLKAAESGKFFIKLELAETYWISGNYDDAAAVCSELEERGISDRRLIDLQVRIATKKQDRQGLVKYVKIYLYNDYADYDAYAKCVKAYIELRMHSEASNLLEDMSIMESDDPEINLLLSKNDYASGRYPSARVAAKKAVRKMPNDIDCLLHISRVYMSMKRPEKALKYLDNILEEDDRHRAALLLKKEIYMSMTPPEYERAKIQCEKIITHYPDDSETLKDLAVVYAKMGKDKESLDAYRRSLDIKKDPVLFMDIITTLARSGKFEDVVDLTNDYETTYGNMVDMWAIRGNAEYQTGDYEAAIRSYTRAVEMDHNRPVLWHSRGMAEEAAGDYDLAEISYDKAVLMDLDNSEYWISKAAVQEKKGDYPGAINSLNRVISTHPENVYSLMRKAMILNRLGKNSEARTFIELASKIDPINMKIMVARRDIYSLEGDTEATKAICSNILSINPNDKKTAIILARMNVKTGNLDEARTILVVQNINTAEFSNDDYEVLNMLREIYHIQGKTHEEISTCKTILQYRPDDKETKVALAEAYIKRGMIDAAKAIYDELHVHSPEDSDFSLKKADMAESREDALKYLMESLNKDPDNKDVLIRLSRMMYEDGKYEDGNYDVGKMKDALVYANRAIEADPTDSRAYVCKIMVLDIMRNFSGVLETVDEAASNVKYKDPLIWKYGGDAQMKLRDYSNALILYDTAMKLGINTREIYFYRGMCQEALGKYDEAINSYTMAYQKDSEDTESMIRAAGTYLKQEKDQSAGRMLEQAMSVDPMLTVAISARATIFASRSNETGVKRMFDHCVQHGVDEETKQNVAELMEKARNKEVVALPVIPLVMPDIPEEIFDHNIGRGTRGEPPDEGEDLSPEESPAEDEDLPQEETPEEETEDLSEEESSDEGETEELAPEEGFDQIDEIPAEEEPEEAPAAEEPEQEETLEDGFFVEEEPEEEEVPQQKTEESTFEESTEEIPAEEEPEEAPAAEEPREAPAEQPQEVPVEEEPVEEPEPEEPVTEETFADDETEAVFFAEEPEEEEEPVEEEPDMDIEEEPIPEAIPAEEPEEVPAVEEETPAEEEPEVIPAPVPEPEPEAEKEESEPRKSVQEYAIDLLRYAHEHGEMPSEGEAAELAGIPADMAEDVLECLSDIKEYGKIDPNGGEFKRMEEMSFRAIVNTGADDIEEDPVISLTSAFFDSGANDLDTAKRLVAYVYEAMTCSIDGHAVYDQISETVDDVEFHASPKSVFEIMSKYRIGVYSARAVQSLVFNKDGQ